jgi:GT2 family glycosyltransferase
MPKNNSERVTIVIVTHNSSAVIGQCLKSIPAEIPVYVVDNESSDDTVAVMRAARPSAHIIENTNVGFGRGNNIALEQVKTEFAFVLNPDTVMQADTIDNLLQVADNYSDAAIIAPTLFYENGTIQKTYKTSVFVREKIKTKYIEPEGDLCAECLLGAAMLLRMDIFRKIGFFDNEIFLCFEDDDLCMKAKQHGHACIITPSSKLMHMMGQSSPPTAKYIYRKNWHMMWSRLYMERKYQGNASMMRLAFKEAILQSGKTIGHAIMLKKAKTVKSLARLIAVFAFVAGVGAF